MNIIEPKQTLEAHGVGPNFVNIADAVRIHGVVGLRVPEKERKSTLLDELTGEVGTLLGWSTEGGSGELFKYREDHSTIEHLSVTGMETPLVPWHVSGIHGEKHHAGVFWEMEKFSAPKGSGKTGFFDCEYLCKIISPKWKELLRSAKVVHLDGYHTKPRSAIEINPLTGNEAIRIRTDSDQCEEKLFSVDEREPTESEQLIFRQISIWAFFNARSNTQHQYFWEWQEGDVVIVDLFRMAHSVFGGFLPGQRVLVGNWAFYE